VAASRGNDTAEDGATRLPVAERITVALIPKAGEDLQHLQDRTSLSKTDLVNRAITLYEFIDAQQRNNRELLVRDRATGETQAIVFL
jgi:hypothetical protein